MLINIPEVPDRSPSFHLSGFSSAGNLTTLYHLDTWGTISVGVLQKSRSVNSARLETLCQALAERYAMNASLVHMAGSQPCRRAESALLERIRHSLEAVPFKTVLIVLLERTRLPLVQQAVAAVLNASLVVSRALKERQPVQYAAKARFPEILGLLSASSALAERTQRVKG
jgi:hypothetical protein